MLKVIQMSFLRRCLWTVPFFVLIYFGASLNNYDHKSQQDIKEEKQISGQEKILADLQEERIDVALEGTGESNALEGTGESNDPLLVLVLSSNPRSGSTLLSQLLATKPDSVLFYEPIWLYEHHPQFVDGSAVENFLTGIFTCTYNSTFENWFRVKNIFNGFYHPSVRECGKAVNKDVCHANINFREICQNSPVRFIKVIRARLKSVEGLLRNPSWNLKILHLTRDPRGVISSMHKLGWKWEPSLRCGDLLEDMKAYETLIQNYPKTLLQVRHEDLSQEPLETVRRLHSFLYGSSSIPWETAQYLQDHMYAKDQLKGGLNTVKDSKQAYQSWRWKIDEIVLSKAENETICQQAIVNYGHIIFGSMNRVNDSDIPLQRQ